MSKFRCRRARCIFSPAFYAGLRDANAGICVNYWCSKNSVSFFAIGPMVSLCVFISGCAAPPVEDAATICTDKSIGQVVQIFRQRRENVRPLRAGGSMRLEWYDSEDKKHEENLNIDLRFCPPESIYFRGSSILGEVVRLGANAQQFWVMIKPKEISTYQWGPRSRVERCSGRQWLNPGNLFEALGMLWIDTGWSVSGDDDLQAMTKTSDRGNVVQKIYVGCNDYLARRIEYYDAEGQVALVLKLDGYRPVGDAAPVPTRINITHYETNIVADIVLKNVKLFEPSPKQLTGLFTRPEPAGFEHVFKLNENCEFVEQ
ncbi:MAG: hypothetical protein DRP65_05780 [Planctomycetota bacterium]|nr:MAG: hypothetical protein DRP65_05780 [Planctomycetota bacterium]